MLRSRPRVTPVRNDAGRAGSLPPVGKLRMDAVFKMYISRIKLIGLIRLVGSSLLKQEPFLIFVTACISKHYRGK